MTDQELKELVASLAVSQKETDQQLKELGKQIGGLGDKFGNFTEGLALPSMTKILGDRFGMDVILPSARARSNGRSMEVDVLASSKKRDDVFVVEVKSHLREDSLDQMRRILREFMISSRATKARSSMAFSRPSIRRTRFGRRCSAKGSTSPRSTTVTSSFRFPRISSPARFETG